jgi:hypothetical protein
MVASAKPDGKFNYKIILLLWSSVFFIKGVYQFGWKLKQEEKKKKHILMLI